MQIIHEIAEMQKNADIIRQSGKTIALVPTMGYLHAGHLALVQEAKKQSDIIVLSIFVNPIQFAAGEDLDKYPRNFEQDKLKAENAGADIVFYPSLEQMYSKSHKTFVQVDELSSILCGVSRPTHFRGVATIVSKLFNIVKPNVTVFGQKDAQQAAIIEHMIKDMNYDIKFIAAPIYREKDGLAMSSRNVNLTKKTRQQATTLYKSLQLIEKKIHNSDMKLKDILEIAKSLIEKQENAKLDYLETRSYPELNLVEKIEGKVLISLAVYFKDVRLIDNIIVE